MVSPPPVGGEVVLLRPVPTKFSSTQITQSPSALSETFTSPSSTSANSASMVLKSPLNNNQQDSSLDSNNAPTFDAGKLVSAVNNSASSLSGTGNGAPHPQTYDMLMHYIYTGDDRYLKQTLSKRSDDESDILFGIVRNCSFTGLDDVQFEMADVSVVNSTGAGNSKPLDGTPYGCIMKCLNENPRKFTNIFHHIDFHETKVPLSFLKTVCRYSREYCPKCQISPVELVMLVLWWKRTINNETSPKQRNHENINDDFGRIEQALNLIDLRLMSMSQLRNAIAKRIIPLSSSPSTKDSFDHGFSVSEDIIEKTVNFLEKRTANQTTASPQLKKSIFGTLLRKTSQKRQTKHQ